MAAILRRRLFLCLSLAWLFLSLQVLAAETTSLSGITTTVPTTGSSSALAVTKASVTSSKISSSKTSSTAYGDVSCTPDAGPEHQCAVQGNPDFYGLGVRLGVYFSWLTSWIANNFLPDEMSGSFDTNSIFLLALELVTVYYSSTYELNIIDALVLLQLSFGFMFSVMSLWGYRTMYYKTEGPDGRKHFGGFGTHCRLLLMGGISVYAVWFWTEGLHDGLPKCSMREDCGGLKTFMFAEVELYGGIRTFYAIAACVSLIYYGMMVFAAVAALTWHCWRLLKGQKPVWEPQEGIDHGLNSNELTKSYILLSAFNFLWMVFAALSVEFTLNFNHVQNVLGGKGLVGAGQLLPLFIGAASFVRLLWLLLREYYLTPHGKIPRMELEPKSAVTPDSAAPLRGFGETGMRIPGSPESPSFNRPGRASTTGNLPSHSKEVNIQREASYGSGGGHLEIPTPHEGRGPRRQHSFVYRILSTWLPWLTTFNWWTREEGGRFQLVAAADGRTPKPASHSAFSPHPNAERSPDVELSSDVKRRPVPSRVLSDKSEEE